MSATDQQRIFAFLADPDTHGLVGQEVKRVRTHVAEVFLAGDRVYKVKRAVRYAFLDFTSLMARRQACKAEVRLNRRTAPDIYLGTSAIRQTRGGTLVLDEDGGGDGQAVEWAVRMRRFDEAQTLDVLADEKSLEPRWIDGLIDAVVALHAEAEVRAAPYGGAEGLSRIIDENLEDMAGYPEVLEPDRVQRLTAAKRLALAANAQLLDRRREEGFVRRCHGDLHLGNVVLWQGRPTPFDCIEFSENIGSIDVVYDLSFLLMDLEVRGLRVLANRAMGRYVGRQGQGVALSALPLMLALRASVRAKVNAMAAADQTDQAERHQFHEAAQRFFRAAEGFLSEQPDPRLLVVGGLSGSGKTTLAAGLAPMIGCAPGALHLRSDILRKRLAGVAPEERLPASAYGRQHGRKVYDTLFQEARAALAAGQAVVLDAVFAQPEERAAAEAIAREAAVPFQGVWLDAPEEALKSRVAARKSDASDATADVVEQQLAYQLGDLDWPRIDAGRRPEAVLKEARDRLLPL